MPRLPGRACRDALVDFGDGRRHARGDLLNVRRGADVRGHGVDEVPERPDPDPVPDGRGGDRGDVDGVVQFNDSDGADGADIPDGLKVQGGGEPGFQAGADPARRRPASRRRR